MTRTFLLFLMLFSLGCARSFRSEPISICCCEELCSEPEPAPDSKLYIFGQVTTPGSYPYKAHITVIELVGLVHGFSAEAEPNKAFITRVRDGAEVVYIVHIADISIGKARNIELSPGDILTIPLREF
jgi:protein involved in polysaccharide export with SLBB domain